MSKRLTLILIVIFLIFILSYTLFDNYLKYIFFDHFITIEPDRFDFIKCAFLLLFRLSLLTFQNFKEKILKNTKLVNGLDMKLTYYRKTKNSLSSSKFTSLINGYRVYKNYMKFNTLKSVYYLIILSINFFKKFF